ncbi:hypothetical protein HAALTHF_34680n [Vreelandella aquamarina]|nr:hypothetical protein HAALTHF_34680n [Halomonas axialensis]
MDLGVGVYRDAAGNTPVMRAVKEAEARLLKNETTKTYIGSHGAPAYGDVVLPMVLGADSAVLKANRASATQSPWRHRCLTSGSRLYCQPTAR